MSLIFVYFLSLLVLATAPPVKHPKTAVNLKDELGPMYETFKNLEGDLKLMYLKELAKAQPNEREKVHQRWREITRRHVAPHSPGSVEQLHDTWRQDDHMDDDSYSPEALFRTHDFDNDGFLSGPEIHTLYRSQLERIYPDHEQAEDILREMQDTRNYAKLLNLMDRNRDGKISLEEFLAYHPSHDEEEDWLDDDDLPDLDHLQEDPIAVDAVKKELNAHPDDAIVEELMHRASGKAAITEKPSIKSYSHHQEHQDAHKEPAVPSANKAAPQAQAPSSSDPKSH